MAVNASSIQIESIGAQASVPKGKAPPLLAPFVSAASAPSPPKTAVLVYNPFGGKKKAAKLVETIVMPMLVEAGVTVDVKPTTHAGHAAELGRTYPLSLPGGTPVDALIAVGGDGTLSELLDGFIQRTDGASCTIGFIPAGTGNTYMHEALGVKTMGAPVAAVRTAVQAIIEGRSRKVDCQQLDMAREDGQPLKKISINTVMAGFGPDANAVAEKRRWLGVAACPHRVPAGRDGAVAPTPRPCPVPTRARLTRRRGAVQHQCQDRDPQAAVAQAAGLDAHLR